MVNKNGRSKIRFYWSTDISVSFLRPFLKYKNLYMLYLCYLKNGFNGEH